MKTFILAAALAAAISIPQIANAQEATAGAAGGAAAGAVTGAVIGGPVGAVVGAGVGGTVGAAAGESTQPRVQERVIIEAPAVRERSCITNARGDQVCQEIRR